MSSIPSICVVSSRSPPAQRGSVRQPVASSGPLDSILERVFGRSSSLLGNWDLAWFPWDPLQNPQGHHPPTSTGRTAVNHFAGFVFSLPDSFQLRARRLTQSFVAAPSGALALQDGSPLVFLLVGWLGPGCHVLPGAPVLFVDGVLFGGQED